MRHSNLLDQGQLGALDGRRRISGDHPIQRDQGRNDGVFLHLRIRETKFPDHHARHSHGRVAAAIPCGRGCALFGLSLICCIPIGMWPSRCGWGKLSSETVGREERHHRFQRTPRDRSAARAAGNHSASYWNVHPGDELHSTGMVERGSLAAQAARALLQP